MTESNVVQIHVEEIERSGFFRVMDSRGRVLVSSTTRPMAATATRLLAEGADPDSWLISYRGGTPSLRAQLWALAEAR